MIPIRQGVFSAMIMYEFVKMKPKAVAIRKIGIDIKEK